MGDQYGGVTFNGRKIVHPGAYDRISSTGMVMSSTGSLNIPVVLGTADAGKPGEIKWFTNADAAKAYFRGGDLPTAIEMMFSPTPDGGGGSSVVGAVVVNSNTQATKTIGGISVTSLEYGKGGNRVQFKVESGTLPGTKRVVATRWDMEKMELYDNLGAVINIQYTGAGTTATAEVTVVGGVATKLETKIGSVVDVTVDLVNGRYTTIGDVVSYLNSISGYVATYVKYRNSDMLASGLDAQTAVNIKSGGYITAVKADIEHQINGSSEIVSVVSSGTITVTPNYEYLSGGVVGSDPASWAPSFDILKRHFSDVLVVLSGSDSIHAEASVHVQQMVNRNQKQVMFTGGLVGENISKTRQRAALLNSSRSVLAYPGIYHGSVNGGKTLLPPYFTSALIAGRVTGLPISEPCTFEYFNLIGLEVDLVVGDPVIDELISSGVATLEKVQNGGIRLVQGITTHQGSNNTLFREISVRRGADALSSRMRSSMERTFVGKSGVGATPSAVETKAIDVLEQDIKDGNIVGYKNISVRFVGTVVHLEYEVAPVEPINFVLVTSHFVSDNSISTIEQ
jgi:hypothetical protein